MLPDEAPAPFIKTTKKEGNRYENWHDLWSSIAAAIEFLFLAGSDGTRRIENARLRQSTRANGKSVLPIAYASSLTSSRLQGARRPGHAGIFHSAAE